MSKLRLFPFSAAVSRARWFLMTGCCALVFMDACTEPSMVRIMDAAAGNGRDAKGGAADVALPAVCTGDAGPASKNKGDPCVCNGECRTGHCADGVCCDSSCDENCKACNLPGTLGECSLIPRGVPPA